MAIARLLSSFQRLKQLAIAMAVFYFLCYISFIMVAVVSCTRDTTWHHVPGPTAVCRSMPLAIAGVIGELLAFSSPISLAHLYVYIKKQWI